MKVTRNNGKIREMIDRENAMAQTEKNAAQIAYIAMMTDTELPEEENENVSED